MKRLALAWLATPIGLAVATSTVALALLAVWWILTAPQREAVQDARDAATGAKAGAEATAAGKATEAVGGLAERQEERAKMDAENKAAILAAEGAEAKVAPPVNDAALAALCRREAYRNDPRCKP